MEEGNLLYLAYTLTETPKIMSDQIFGDPMVQSGSHEINHLGNMGRDQWKTASKECEILEWTSDYIIKENQVFFIPL